MVAPISIYLFDVFGIINNATLIRINHVLKREFAVPPTVDLRVKFPPTSNGAQLRGIHQLTRPSNVFGLTNSVTIAANAVRPDQFAVETIAERFVLIRENHVNVNLIQLKDVRQFTRSSYVFGSMSNVTTLTNHVQQIPLVAEIVAERHVLRCE